MTIRSNAKDAPNIRPQLTPDANGRLAPIGALQTHEIDEPAIIRQPIKVMYTPEERWNPVAVSGALARSAHKAVTAAARLNAVAPSGPSHRLR